MIYDLMIYDFTRFSGLPLNCWPATEPDGSDQLTPKAAPFLTEQTKVPPPPRLLRGRHEEGLNRRMERSIGVAAEELAQDALDRGDGAAAPTPVTMEP